MTISLWWSKFSYIYTITAGGIVKFNFESNNYWSVLWRGGAKTLAEGIYKTTKSINRNWLYGRTIGGVHTELELHYVAFKLHIFYENAKSAEIGGISKKNPGYDSNAWFFEGANAAKIIAKISLSNIWASLSLIRDIGRYL